ncbi:MAG TPA: type II toxin-antitoxin system HicA family toxin [Vicinamibacteria bacterium]|jgi:predicted RNA binding protein YcfA (HicA-like mRNA interferase family)
MPRRLKRLGAREVLQALKTFGFETVSTRGSHAKLKRKKPGGGEEILTVPLHKELAAGTLRAIYRQSLRFVPEKDLRPLFFGE